MANANEVRTHYERWHASMAEVESDHQEAIYPWHKTALRLMPQLNGKRVLEIGCGRGDFAILLGRRYPKAEVVGTDFSEVAIQAAVAKSPPPNVTFEVKDAEAPSTGDGF